MHCVFQYYTWSPSVWQVRHMNGQVAALEMLSIKCTMNSCHWECDHKTTWSGNQINTTSVWLTVYIFPDLFEYSVTICCFVYAVSTFCLRGDTPTEGLIMEWGTWATLETNCDRQLAVCTSILQSWSVKLLGQTCQSDRCFDGIMASINKTPEQTLDTID